MPRASRHFLPGYVWHITRNETVSPNRARLSTASLRSSRYKVESVQQFQPFQWLHRFAPFKLLKGIKEGDRLFRNTRSVPLPALAVRSQETPRFVRPQLYGDI